MTTPYDPEGLWLKAQLFLNRSFDAGGDFPLSALWAAVSLELLGKWALATHNPLLIADPEKSGNSLLVAAGLSQDLSSFRSVPAHTVFSRCEKAFPPFSAKAAIALASERNEELHGGLPAYAGKREEPWWDSFWFLVSCLVHGHQRTPEDLLGSERAAVAHAAISRNKASVETLVRSLMAKAKERYAVRDADAGVALVVARLYQSAQMSEYAYKSAVTCPSCSSPAELGGEFATDSETVHGRDFDEDDTLFHEISDYGVYEVLTVVAEMFACPACGLRLPDASHIEAAGLGTHFDVLREYDPGWDEYGND